MVDRELRRDHDRRRERGHLRVVRRPGLNATTIARIPAPTSTRRWIASTPSTWPQIENGLSRTSWLSTVRS